MDYCIDYKITIQLKLQVLFCNFLNNLYYFLYLKQGMFEKSNKLN